MKPWLLLVYGLLLGVLVTGAILLISRPTQGMPVELFPAPSPSPTSPPAPTKTPEPIMVQIKGEIVSPGSYSLAKDSRLDDLITAAGGITSSADENRINYMAIVHDGDYFYIPTFDEDIPETASNAPGNLNIGDGDSFDYPIDLNAASQEALESLPGIGPSKASDILAYREEHGPFASVDDLVNVPGIGASTVETLRDFLIVEP